MLDLYQITVGPWAVTTYTLALALGILAGIGLGLARTRAQGRLAARVDVYLGGLVAGALLGRAAHVLLHWAYFAYNLGEAYRIAAGGVDWHGAVLGALLGMALVARWRRVRLWPLIDALTPALALLALAGWFGCWTANCAYGAEVQNLADYPPWMAWEGRDIFGIFNPRFNVQFMGMMLSVVILLGALLLMAFPRLGRLRFWIVLALIALGAFALGFLRGDYAVYSGGLRADQWLDLGVVIFSLGMAIIATFRQRQPAVANRPPQIADC